MDTRATWRRGIFGAVVVLGMMGLAACLPVGVGDPAKSKVDGRLVGVWAWRDGLTQRAVIRAWDERTYVVDVMGTELMADGTERPRSRYLFKGWLTEVKGQQFLTLEPADSVGALAGDDRPKEILIARVRIEGDVLIAEGVNADFKNIRELKTAAEVERLIAENIEDPKLLAKPILATKWVPDGANGLKKWVEMFREMK